MIAVIGALVIFPALMAFAAWSDLFTMTISNLVSLALLVGFILMALAVRLPLELVFYNLSCGAFILAGAFALFCFGWIGGGDAKLAAGTAIWLGWAHILDYGLIASVLGGALTFALLGARRFPLPLWARRPWVERLHDVKSGVPYGIALAVAGLLLYPSTQIWLSVSGS